MPSRPAACSGYHDLCHGVDGVQYVAVAAGGNAYFGFCQGGALVVFALPKRR